MNTKQKIQYFFDYYFKGLLIVIGVFLIALYFIWNYFRPQPETILNVAVLNEQLNETEKEKLLSELEKYFDIEQNQQIIIDDNYNMQEDGLAKLQVYLYNHEIDVILAEEEQFRELAGYGYLKNIEGVLGERYAEAYVEAAEYEDSDEIYFDKEKRDRKKMQPYGIRLPIANGIENSLNYLENPILAFAQESRHSDWAVRFLEFIME